MRKLTLKIEPYISMKEATSSIFEKIHSYEILETLKIDWEEGICVDLIEFHLKDGLEIGQVNKVGDMEIISILKSQGFKHTCLVKTTEPEGSKGMFKEFDLDLIFSTPLIITPEKHTYSVIGDNINLRKFIDLIRSDSGRIVNISFKKAEYTKKDILETLTGKQRETIILAHRLGYYDYPKRITSKQLSEKLNISKGTMVEHLRKAERRILDEIVTGYW